MLGFLYFVSLVIGSGGVAVKDVITCVAERLVVTGGAVQSRSVATQVAQTFFRRDLRQRKERIQGPWSDLAL